MHISFAHISCTYHSHISPAHIIRIYLLHISFAHNLDWSGAKQNACCMAAAHLELSERNKNLNNIWTKSEQHLNHIWKNFGADLLVLLWFPCRWLFKCFSDVVHFFVRFYSDGCSDFGNGGHFRLILAAFPVWLGGTNMHIKMKISKST